MSFTLILNISGVTTLQSEGLKLYFLSSHDQAVAISRSLLMKKRYSWFKSKSTTQDFNSFVSFMTDLKQKFIDQGFRLERIMIVKNNASIHVSKFSKDSIKKLNLQCLTICPYSPSLNPIEKVIRWIKSKLRSKGYSNSIDQTSKHIIKIAENLKPETIRNWINQCKMECLDQLNFLISS